MGLTAGSLMRDHEIDQQIYLQRPIVDGPVSESFFAVQQAKVAAKG